MYVHRDPRMFTGADCAARAADAYAYAYARRETQQKTADIVRSMITVEEVEMAIQGQGRER